MSITPDAIKTIPRTPGIYVFKRGQTPLYVGKAVNLKNRVSSYFRGNVADKVIALREEATRLDWIEMRSGIEALIKEAELIKRYDPKYNVLIHEYFYVGITREPFPKLFVTRAAAARQTESSRHGGRKVSSFRANYIGPFTSGSMLRAALKSLRRLFPYCTCFKPHKRKCLNVEIGRCQGYCCADATTNNQQPTTDKKSTHSKEYRRNIQAIIAILTGKRVRIVSSLKKELQAAVKKEEFERAARLRDQIAGLEDVFEHRPYLNENGKRRRSFTRWPNVEKTIREALGLTDKSPLVRVEGYDISNISGASATGSMVVFMKGRPSKDDYRMFKIRSLSGHHDVGMHKEVMRRRLAHPEWPLPDLFVIDGGKPQLNAILEVIRGLHPELASCVTALAKREEELYHVGGRFPIRLDSLPSAVMLFFQYVRNESHRFAKKYHHKVREITYREEVRQNKN